MTWRLLRSGSLCGCLQGVVQRPLQFGESEFVSGAFHPRRGYARAGKQDLIGHLTESEACGESRQRKKRRFRERARQRGGKLAIGHRIRGDDVDRPMKGFIVNRMIE